MLPSLVKLEMEGVDNIKELWCSQLPSGCFQNLKVLDLNGCPNLLNVFPSHFQLNLESLTVIDCGSVEHVFSFKGVKAENIKGINVSKCHRLRNLFSSSTFKGLLHLESLEVSDCKLMEVVVAKEEGVEDGRMDIVVPLNYLSLSELPRLKSFCHVNYALELPELKWVDVNDCPKMSCFSLGSVSTPKLRSLEVDAVNDVGDLNSTIQQVFKEKEAKGKDTVDHEYDESRAEFNDNDDDDDDEDDQVEDAEDN